MLYRFVALLTVVALLTCPYVCPVNPECCASVDAKEPMACCAACEPRHTSPPAKEFPAEDGCCDDWCLCQGAVLDHAVVVVGPPTVQSCDVLDAADAQTASPVTETFSPGPDATFYGEGLRVAIRSLLC